MKKLLIVNNNMHLGGVQRSLVDLLTCIHDRYDITLVLFHPAGKLLEQLPSDVKLLPVTSAYRYLGMTSADAAGTHKLRRSFYAAITRLLGRDRAVGLMALGQKRLSGFDAAVSFLHDARDKAFYGGCNDFVLRHVQAKKKVTFLHCDFSLVGGNTPANRRRYEAFDGIAACSEGCARQFLACMPQLEHKTHVVYNCHNFESIRIQAQQAAVCLTRDRVNILTVARLGKEKGVSRAIEAFGKLKQYDFHYYIVGDGVQRPQVEEAIAALGLKDRVTMVGELENPYGYIQAADLLLIPSVSEAAPMVIGEAACLGTPVLSTETSSAREMVEATGYGWVCPNSVEGLAAGLQSWLEAPVRLSSACPDNRLALQQFNQLLAD